jgi:hypothetical protein
MPKEAQARIKINHLLEAAGWRFFDSPAGRANIALEPNVKLTQEQVDAIATQRTIVTDIEAEQALVAANRELIRRFEAKIKTTIDRVWSPA